MRQGPKPSNHGFSPPKPFHRYTRQKRCLCCGELFESDPRTKGKQRYCSRSPCQTKRQRHNESAWRKRNPDCLGRQSEQSRHWHQARPDYSRARRINNPLLLEQNRCQTRLRMKKIRGKELFDKSKVILTQLIGAKADKCYLAHRSRWFLARLTKASPLLRPGSLWDNRGQSRQANNCLPKSRFYELSGVF